jgi:hypothetical protein
MVLVTVVPTLLPITITHPEESEGDDGAGHSRPHIAPHHYDSPLRRVRETMMLVTVIPTLLPITMTHPEESEGDDGAGHRRPHFAPHYNDSP